MLLYIKKQYRKYIKRFIPRWIFSCKDRIIMYYRRINFYVFDICQIHKKESISSGQKGSISCDKEALVSIVVLSFERGKQTKKTIEAILQHSKNIKKEIIIWDNASKDQITLDVLERVNKRSDVKVIFNDKNLRCGGSRKEVIKLVNGKYILFLDNDIEISANVIESLINRLNESVDYMGACCCVVFPDHSIQLNGGSFVRDDKFISFKLMDAGKRENDISAMVKRECDWIPGGASMFRQEVFDEVEHDAGYPNAYEDTDFSLLITEKLGKKVVNCPTAKVIHHHIDYELIKDKGTKKYEGTRYNKEMFIKSWLHFYDKWDLIIRDDFILGLIGLRDGSDDEIVQYVKKHVSSKK